MNKTSATLRLKNLYKTGNIELAKKFFLENMDMFDHSSICGISNIDTKFNILIYRYENGIGIFNFCKGLTDENFCFDRYELYAQFRMKNKSDSFSEQFFKLKYGDDWEIYRNNKLLKKPNLYDTSTYIQKGYTLNEAEYMVTEAKEKTTISLNKMIEKYGLEKGTEFFKKSCRRHKNFIDYWIKINNGDVEKAQIEFDTYKRESSPKCIEYYTKRNISDEDAIKHISMHQRSCSGLHKEYYVSRGYTTEDIEKIFLQINSKKDSSSIYYLIETFKNLSLSDIEDLYKSYNATKSSTFRKNGFLAKDDPDLDRKLAYEISVDYYTKLSITQIPECKGVRGRTKGCYHLDHKFSKKQGFIDCIPPEIIGSPVNLEWILSEENCSKRAACSIDKDTLLKEYKQYENYKNSTTYL